jgi:trigger factor
MKSDLVKVNKNQIKATIELDKNDLKKYLDKAEKTLGEDVEIKGFRKGKAPSEILRKNLDQDKVRSLALELAIEGSLSEVIKKNSFDVLNTSELSIENNDISGLRYSVLLELFPLIKLVDLKNIKIKRKNIQVDDREIDEALEVIKNSRANFIDKSDNEIAEEGDRVEIDFEVKKDNKIIEGGVSKNHPLIIGGKSFIPGFEEQLIGMKKGEEKTFSLVAPSDYFYKDIAGKELNFVVKLVDIKKVIMPVLDDNFARSLGRFADIADLRRKVKDNLIEEKKIKEKQKIRLEILENIIDNSQIDVPESLVNRQLDLMIQDFDNNLHEKGLELSLYLSRIGKDEKELRKDWTKEAERQVKMSLVLREIAKNLNITASEREIEEMMAQVAESMIIRNESKPPDINFATLKESIESRIVNEKAFEYLESQCVI